MNIADLIGLPLQEVISLCAQAGLKVRTTPYAAPRPLIGAADERVVRVRQEEETIEILYSAFITQLHE